MALSARLGRVGARLDRLPAAWAIATGGFALHLALVAGLLATTVVSGTRVGLLVTALLLAILVLAGLAALPAVVLWRLGRYERAGAVAAALVAIATLAVNEAHPTIWPFPLALALAAARAWAGQRLDTTDLLALDPGRFERVEPGTDDAGDDAGRVSSGEPPDDSADAASE